MKNQTNNAKGSAVDPKIKNIVIGVLIAVLLVYAFIIYIVPIGFNDKLKSKEIIPELEKLTNLRITYDSAFLKIMPNFDVVVKFNNFKAEKKDVDQQVASAASMVFVMDPMVLVSKNYNLKDCYMTGVEYYEVIDDGVPEIKTFLQNYSLLSTAGGPYKIKVCPIDIRYFFKYSYDSSTGAYSETRDSSLYISADSFAEFIDTVSNGGIRTRK